MSPAPQYSSTTDPNRRSQQRFAISFPMRYVISGVEGEGITLNICSGGILFQLPQKLPVGRRIRLFIEWPVKLEDRIPLYLVVEGVVLRSTGTVTAATILQYEFRLRSGPRTFVKCNVGLVPVRRLPSAVVASAETTN
jgi:hypothetical protein